MYDLEEDPWDNARDIYLLVHSVNPGISHDTLYLPPMLQLSVFQKNFLNVF